MYKLTEIRVGKKLQNYSQFRPKIVEKKTQVHITLTAFISTYQELLTVKVLICLQIDEHVRATEKEI